MKNPYFTRKSPVRFCCRKKRMGCKEPPPQSLQPATRAVSRVFELSKKWVAKRHFVSQIYCKIKKPRCLAIYNRVAVMSFAVFTTFCIKYIGVNFTMHKTKKSRPSRSAFEFIFFVVIHINNGF